MTALLGIQILESAHCVTDYSQFRFPKSKKSRIRRKWAKRAENFRGKPAMFRMGNQIVAHPSLVAELRKQIPSV